MGSQQSLGGSQTRTDRQSTAALRTTPSRTISPERRLQYYTMFGTGEIYKDGWKAASLHAPFSDGHYDEDKWELYHVAVDRAAN